MARVWAGDWDSSNVHEDHLSFLHQTWRLPRETHVKVRVPLEAEVSTVAEDDERVIFRSHFLRGFGLPASGFFRSFLTFYQVQPHHLTPNTVVLLAAFVTMCEGYLGTLHTLELWAECFYLKLGTSS